MVFNFTWSRDTDFPFPKIWIKFQAKDIVNDKLVEYHVQEVTEDRFEEAYRLLAEDYLLNEPINSSLDIAHDPQSEELFKRMCWDSMKQTVFLCCIDTSTNRIAGANVLFIISKEDQYNDQLLKAVSQAANFKTLIDSLCNLYVDFDIFDHYKVDKYIGSFGLSVAKPYVGRGIGRELFAARKLMGDTFGIKITHTMFTSKYSNRIALAIGFQIDREISYEKLIELDKRYSPYSKILDHGRITAATWMFDSTI